MLFSSVNGVSLIFIISGTVGPNMSASRIPTVFPSSDKDTAKFTAVVVFPKMIDRLISFIYEYSNVFELTNSTFSRTYNNYMFDIF